MCSTTSVVFEGSISEQQLAYLEALWRLGEAPVNEVQAELQRDGRTLAATTVATVLKRLEKKGLVTHREEGRTYVYRALVSKREVRTSALGRIRDHLFGGDVTALVSQLLDTNAVTRDELDDVRRLLDAKRKEREQ